MRLESLLLPKWKVSFVYIVVACTNCIAKELILLGQVVSL